MDNWIYNTWRRNDRSKYNGQTHKVLKDTLVNLRSNLKVGVSVVVYWESDLKCKLPLQNKLQHQLLQDKSILRATSTPTG